VAHNPQEAEMAIVYSIGQVMRVYILIDAVLIAYMTLPPYIGLLLSLAVCWAITVSDHDDFAAKHCAVVRGTILIILGGMSIALFLSPYTSDVFAPQLFTLLIAGALGALIIFFTEFFSYRPWPKITQSLHARM